jgi:hypothetical protein
VPMILMFSSSALKNHEVIKQHVDESTKIFTVPFPPPIPESGAMLDYTNMMGKYL